MLSITVIMYRLGERQQQLGKRHIAGAVLVVGLVAAGLFMLSRVHTRPSAQLTTAPPVVRHIGGDSGQKNHIDEGLFAFDLPADWKLTAPGSAKSRYSFRGMLKSDDSRSLEIYVDQVPTSLAVNRLVALRAVDNGLSHGPVSDNCVNFTSDELRSTAEAQTTKVVPATWQGVDFLCDIGNYSRNVVGTGSPGNLNSVSLSGPTTGRHSFFFAYTDNNINPDYSVFYTALESFHLK